MKTLEKIKKELRHKYTAKSLGSDLQYHECLAGNFDNLWEDIESAIKKAEEEAIKEEREVIEKRIYSETMEFCSYGGRHEWEASFSSEEYRLAEAEKRIARTTHKFCKKCKISRPIAD